jgi:ribosomal protein S18 acetylase RimI-like enzyme
MASIRSSAAVWRAGPADADAVARLLIDFRDHLGKRDPADDAFTASARRLIEDPHTEFWLASAERGAEAAAICQIRFRHSVWTSVDDCWLEDLFVRSEARGLGLGRALVERVLGRASERGCARVELDTNEDNRAAIALYESLDFSATSKGGSRSLLYGRSVSSLGHVRR